jgi:hypothetical protein
LIFLEHKVSLKIWILTSPIAAKCNTVFPTLEHRKHKRGIILIVNRKIESGGRGRGEGEGVEGRGREREGGERRESARR